MSPIASSCSTSARRSPRARRARSRRIRTSSPRTSAWARRRRAMKPPPPETLPALVHGWAERVPEQVALREKELGRWREITWRQYRDEIAAASRALFELGIRAGDHVAILSDNRPEWLYADLGAQAIGARGVGVYQTNPPE